MNVEEALFILDTVLQKILNNVQELVFRQAWEGKTYPEMAESSGYNAHYIKDVGYKLWKLLSNALEEKVTKSNFRSVLRRRYFAFEHAGRASYLEEIASLNDVVSGQEIGEGMPSIPSIPPSPHPSSMGEVVEVSSIYGRTEELKTLKQWIVDACYRLMALLGMGGIGTPVSIRGAEQSDEFDYLIWRSLLHALPNTHQMR